MRKAMKNCLLYGPCGIMKENSRKIWEKEANPMQKKILYLRLAVFGISAVLLLSLLAHSALFLAMNTWFAVENGTLVTNENRQLIETRFAMRDAADAIARTGTGVFGIGCLVLLYPLMAMRKMYPPKKIIAWLLGLLLSILVVTVPFMLKDTIYGHADYFLPVLHVLPCIALLFLVSAAQILFRKFRNE